MEGKTNILPFKKQNIVAKADVLAVEGKTKFTQHSDGRVEITATFLSVDSDVEGMYKLYNELVNSVGESTKCIIRVVEDITDAVEKGQQ